MKKILVVLGFLIISCCSSLGVHADNITVVYNGEMLWFDAPPQMVNDRVLVPMRTIFETIGAEVEWDEETQSVKAFDGKTVVSFSIGDKFIYTNGNKVELDSEIIKANDRTLIPVRAIAESFDNNVFWSSSLNRVLITDYTMIDLIGQPLYLMEYLFGGDYEDRGYYNGGICLTYADNRIPGGYFYPYNEKNYDTKKISAVTITGFCKIANGLYGGISRNDLIKKGYSGTLCSAPDFKTLWEFRAITLEGNYQTVKANLYFDTLDNTIEITSGKIIK